MSYNAWNKTKIDFLEYLKQDYSGLPKFSTSSISLLLNLRVPIPKHIFQLDNNELQQLLFDDHVTQMYANEVPKLFN